MRKLNYFDWAMIGVTLWFVALPFTLGFSVVLTIFPASERSNIWVITGGCFLGTLITGMMILGCKMILGRWPWEYAYTTPERPEDSKPPKR
jgi:hypothetical protein